MHIQFTTNGQTVTIPMENQGDLFAISHNGTDILLLDLLSGTEPKIIENIELLESVEVGKKCSRVKEESK